jgi:hypothetical protein
LPLLNIFLAFCNPLFSFHIELNDFKKYLDAIPKQFQFSLGILVGRIRYKCNWLLYSTYRSTLPRLTELSLLNISVSAAEWAGQGAGIPGEAWPGPSAMLRDLPGHSSLSYLSYLWLIFQSQLLSGLDKVLVYLERRGQAPLPSLEIYLAIVHCLIYV